MSAEVAPGKIMVKNNRSEFREIGSQCVYSFVFSALAAFVVCALAPEKPCEPLPPMHRVPSLTNEAISIM